MSTAPTSFTRYEERYARDSEDPFNGDSSPLLTVFKPGIKTAAQLYDSVISANDSTLQACIGLVQYRGEPHYKLYHGVKKYPKHLVQTTDWDDQAFAFTGDYTGATIGTVDFPNDVFEVPEDGTSYNVPIDFERAKSLLEQYPEEEFLGPFNNNDAQIKTVQARYFMPLPHKYVNLFLAKPAKARDAFVTLGTAMTHQGDLELEPLLDWMLLSITREAPGDVPALAREEFAAPAMDESLSKHREELLLRHLPGLRAPSSTDLSAIHQNIARAMEKLANETEKDRKERAARDEKGKQKQVSQWLDTHSFQRLLKYCDCAAEEDLPPVWRALANASKSQDRTALEAMLMATAEEFGRPSAAPVVTGDLVTRVKSLQFHQQSAHDLSSGIQPFNLFLTQGYTDPELEALALEARNGNYDYDTIMTGASVSLFDLQKLKKGKVAVPVTFEDGVAHILAWVVTWTTLLGTNHPFAKHIVGFFNKLNGNENGYRRELQKFQAKYQIPGITLLLRRIQLRCQHYWFDLWQGYRSVNEVPDLMEILGYIMEANYSWVPQFPQQYLKAQPTLPAASFQIRIDDGSTISGITGGTSGTGTGPTGASGGTGRSGGGTDATRGTTNNGVPNPAKNPIFAPFNAKIQQMTIVEAMRKANTEPNPVEMPKVLRPGADPTTGADLSAVPRVMCGSYHLKGSCWTNCKRKYDHGPHTADEDSQLLTWCQRAYA